MLKKTLRLLTQCCEKRNCLASPSSRRLNVGTQQPVFFFWPVLRPMRGSSRCVAWRQLCLQPHCPGSSTTLCLGEVGGRLGAQKDKCSEGFSTTLGWGGRGVGRRLGNRACQKLCQNFFHQPSQEVAVHCFFLAHVQDHLGLDIVLPRNSTCVLLEGSACIPPPLKPAKCLESVVPGA